MTRPGYILIAALTILSLMMILVSSLYRQGFVQLTFDKLMVDREQARLLAYSGIECAISTLSVEQKTENKDQKKDPDYAMKRLVPLLNQWRTFKLTKDVDGVNGSIKICITSESGKIPLDKWFDSSKRTFVNEGKDTGDMKAYVQKLCANLKTYTGDKDLFKSLETYLKDKKTNLFEVSQLLTIKEFQNIFFAHLFYQPPAQDSKQKRPIFLMDLFTLWSDSPNISVWFLTDAVMAAYGLPRVSVQDAEKRMKVMQDAFKSGQQLPADIKQLWPLVFQELYGKEFSSLPSGSDTVLKAGFDSKVFSVLSYGTVGKVTYKLYGILQQVEKGDHKEYKLIRVYTL